MFNEPLYAEPHVRWCGRAAGVTRPLPDQACSEMRHTLLDHLLIAADEALRALSGAGISARPSPAGTLPDGGEVRVSAGLMRVNHSGEICAQALYSGQALFAQDARVRHAL